MTVLCTCLWAYFLHAINIGDENHSKFTQKTALHNTKGAGMVVLQGYHVAKAVEPTWNCWIFWWADVSILVQGCCYQPDATSIELGSYLKNFNTPVVHHQTAESTVLFTCRCFYLQTGSRVVFLKPSAVLETKLQNFWQEHMMTHCLSTVSSSPQEYSPVLPSLFSKFLPQHGAWCCPPVQPSHLASFNTELTCTKKDNQVPDSHLQARRMMRVRQ